MDRIIVLSTPLSTDKLKKLRIGDRVLLNGIVYAARDAAHKRLIELLKAGDPLPFSIQGQVIYYLGPTPAKPGKPIGAAGPTSSYRMDEYSVPLIEKGLKGMIGKGARSLIVREAMQTHKAVYFAAIGGAGALISRSIISAEIIAYPELDTEAIRKMTVKDFPVIVANDVYGGDLYETGVRSFRTEIV
ncbi:MAG: Fe-S-containing hydro-lyase [Deltaproteobacteria bacterium]|nr:Fe-S-containing hydro-lyase [Deltaproteobacteria bacterium]MBW1960187.1 Fe-S-containing hydro-lyase [Deltaproteobacteria bacterium]MBW1994076.1 Fe-S-containing hydro-lyase [Deltaproteobacteria bacterium]MBW2152030.1 Fe-S-containing hydro-lyase [Deltaproteobacteria bacterium]